MLKMWNSCSSKGLSSVPDSSSEVPASFADITLQPLQSAQENL